jgi:hypothetical protein
VVQVPEFLNELPWAMQETVKRQTAAIEKDLNGCTSIERKRVRTKEATQGQIVIFMIEKSSPSSSEPLTS